MTDVRFYHLTRSRLEDALPVRSPVFNQGSVTEGQVLPDLGGRSELQAYRKLRCPLRATL